MNPLIPPVFTTIMITCFLIVICAHMYRQERDKALKTWAITFCVFLLRQIGALLSVFYPASDLYHAGNHAIGLFVAFLLLRAACQWASVATPRFWYLALTACFGWVVCAEVADWPHMVSSLPPSLLSALMRFIAGITLLRSPRRVANLGAAMSGWGLIAWALHTLDHPLSWELDSYLPWDYELDAFFALYFGVSIWLMYFGESRLILQAGVASYESLVSGIPTLFWQMEGEHPRQVFRSPERSYRDRKSNASISTDWAEAIHPDDFHRVTSSCNAAIGKREPFSLEYRLRGAGGTYRWVKDDGAPVFDKRGQYSGYVGAATDITRQKENEVHLLERERRLQVLFEEAADAIFVSDDRGRLVQVNEQACRSTGYSRSELLTMNVTDLDSVTNTAADFGGFVAGFSNSKTQQVQTRHRRKDGTEFPVEVRIARISTVDGVVIIGTARDLSERVADELRYAQILETSIDSFWLVDETGHLAEVNAAAAAQLGYSVPEMLGMAVHEIDGEEDAEDTMRRIQLIAEHGHLRFEAKHRCKNGRLIDVDVSVSQHPGIPGYTIGFQRDITERKHAEAALRKSEAFLNRSQSVGHIGSWEFDLAAGQVRCSEEFGRIFEIDFLRGEVPARWLFRFIHPDDWRGVHSTYTESLNDAHQFHEAEFRITRSGDNEVRVVQTRFEHERDNHGRVLRTLGVVQDVTDQRRQRSVSDARLRLVEYANQGRTSHELLQRFLDEAERLTDSEIGFFHFVEADQETLSLQAWSTNTLAHMCTAEGEGQHYPISQAGVWVDCVHAGKPVIHNDYPSLLHKKGLPAGHAPVLRQLVVPVARSGQIVAILGVGNKPSNYSDYDRDMIVELADVAWDTVVRTRAEEALHASEEKFSKAFWNAPFPMTINAIEDGKYLEANEAFYRITGLTADRTLGFTLPELTIISKSDRRKLATMIDSAGFVKEMELDLSRIDGSEVTVLYSCTAVEVDGVMRLLSTAVDITERKRAERQLEYAYELLERSNEAARIGHWEIDLDRMGLSWSRVAREIFELETDAPVGLEQWLGHYPKSNGRQGMSDAVSAAFGTGHPLDIESTITTAVGRERFVRTIGIPVMVDGRCERMYGLIQDLTERRQSERELQRQNQAISLTKNMTSVFLTSSREHVFQDLIKVVQDATDSRFGLFGYIDANGDLTCPAFSDVLWSASDDPGHEIVFPRNNWAGIWGGALSESRTFVVNEKLQVPEGHLNLDNAIATPLIHQGRAIGLFVLANRIGGYSADEVSLLESAALQTAPVLNAYLERAQNEAEHERLEAQFRQAQKMEAIGQLTGGVAHDFNNLLQIIIGYSELLLVRNDSSEQTHNLLEQIASAGHRAARLVSQLLLFSRRQIMRPESLNLNETTSDLIKMLGRIIGEQVQIRWHPASSLDYIYADRSMIEQTLTNLCVNARDAMPEGGIVTLETREVTLAAEDCASNPEAVPGGYVLLSVTDTGCGMTEETMLRIFEPFYTTKAVGKGTGLGLATVYGIVKQHNGIIDVKSRLGEGTTFSLFWPVQVARECAPVTTPVDEVVPGGTETVLLAEDDEAVRVLVKQILEGAGYTVLIASDGAEALDTLKGYSGNIDIAILDVVMPNMGGHEAYQKMLMERPGLKAFFASGYSEDAIHKNFVLDEGLTLIQKPYTQNALLKMVRQVLSQH